MYTPPPDVNGINTNHSHISLETTHETQKWGSRKIENLTDSQSSEITSIYQSSQRELDDSFDNFSEKELKQSFALSEESELINRTEIVFDSIVFDSTVNNPVEEDIFGNDSEDIFGDSSNSVISYDEEIEQKNLNIEEQQLSLEMYNEGATEKDSSTEKYQEISEQKEEVNTLIQQVDNQVQKINFKVQQVDNQVQQINNQTKLVDTQIEQVDTQAEEVNAKAEELESDIVEFQEVNKVTLEQLREFNAVSELAEGFRELLKEQGVNVEDLYLRTELERMLGPNARVPSEEKTVALGQKLVTKGLKNKKFQKNGRLLTKSEARVLLVTFNQGVRKFYHTKIKPFYVLQQQQLKEKKKLEEESQSPHVALPTTENIKPKEVFVSQQLDEMPFASKMDKILERKLDEAAALARRVKEEKIDREEINYMRLRHAIVSKEVNHSEINKKDQKQQNFKIEAVRRSKMAEPIQISQINMKAKS